MVACKLLLYVWMGFLITNGIGERLLLRDRVEASRTIRKGSTKSEVLSTVGEPDIRWKARIGLSSFIFGSRPPQWVYGPSVDLEFLVIPEFGVLNPIPFHLRLFSAYETDLVIDWSKKGTVASITRPDVEVAAGIENLYEPFRFLGRVSDLAVKAAREDAAN